MTAALVRITYEIDVELSAEELVGVNAGRMDAEDAVIYRAIEQMKEDLGENRSEEIVGLTA